MKSLTSQMKLLVESITLVEGYEDRVQQAAKFIVDTHGYSGKIDKAKLLSALQMERGEATKKNKGGYDDFADYSFRRIMPEVGLSDQTWRQAGKDILAAISAGGYIKRAAPATPRAPYSVRALHDTYGDEKRVPVTHDEISELGFKLMSWAGESFPDGDPNDRVMQWMERKGWDVSDAYERIMPVACKKSLGTKDYSEYLAQLWDDVYGDTKSYADGEGLGYSDERPEDHMDDADRLLRSMGNENPWRSRR